MKYKSWFLSLLSILLLFAITGCTTNEMKKHQSLQTLRVAEVTRSVFYAPQYVALEKGFFKNEGIKVKLTTTWGGDKTMTALLSNGADIALVGSETSIYVKGQGTNDPVVNFAQLTQTDGTFLLARKPSDHFEWTDLKGKHYLGQRKGGMPQMVGEYVLKKNHIDPKNDLDVIQNVDFANLPNAFAAGTGDYVQLFEPTASIFEKQGTGYIVASFGKESGHVPYTTYMSKSSYMKKESGALYHFTKAIYEAQKWVQNHSANEVADMIAPYFKDTDKEILISSIKRYQDQDSFAHDPILDQAEWTQLQDIMEEAGELPARIDYSTLVNTSIAKKAMNN